jgi:alkaline phosphatase
VQLDRRDPHNPVIRISHGNRQAALPVNKNLVYLDGREIPLEGVVVHIPETDTIYLPRQAVHLIQGESKPLPRIGK